MAEEQKPQGGQEAPKEGAAELTPEEQAAIAAKGKKKKLLMMGAAGLAVVGIAVAVGVVFLMKPAEDKHEGAETASVPKALFMEVPELTLNMLAEGGKQSFLRVKVSVELANPSDQAAFAVLLPKLQDDWIAFLRQLRPTDVQGTAAMARLKEGLLRRANQVMVPVVLKGVFVTEMLVQ